MAFKGRVQCRILNPEYGGVAQLGEHLPCTQGVRSSNLLISTRGLRKRANHGTGYGRIAQLVRVCGLTESCAWMPLLLSLLIAGK